MPDNLKDILNQLPPEIDEETLLKYLQGKLSPSEQHQVEKQMLDADFESDALEGLLQVKDESRLQFLLDQLQRDLKQKTAKKKAFRERLRFREQPTLWGAILLLLLLIVISYLVIQKLHQG